MKNLSSNSLFHFTSQAQYLIGILSNNFLPRYCYEKIELNTSASYGKKISGAIPMICFCDIPLGQIHGHINTYGSYGIGMTKDWGIENDLNPIIYLNQDTELSICLSEMAKICSENKKENSIKEITKRFVKVIKYVKPYQGDFERRGTIIKQVRFYNEREWRYIPKLSTDSKKILIKDDFDNPVTLSLANQDLEKYDLAFTPDDIKYIFVKDQKEIHPMIEAIRKIKSKYSDEQVDILTSKILTTEQILEDF